MLVLGRTVDEVICIGDDIEVLVTGIAGNRVSLAITAPRCVQILRKELKERRGGKKRTTGNEKADVPPDRLTPG